MKKYLIELKWALVFTLMYLGWMLLEKFAGLHDQNLEKHSLYTNLMAIPAVAVYIFALIDKKRNFYENIMFFKQGFNSAMIMSCFILILGPLRQIVTVTYLIPDFFHNSIEHAVSSGSSTLEEAQSYFNLKSYIFYTLFGDFFMGLITSAVAATIVKTKQKWS